MIFQHTWKLILEGKKTETRRPVKPGERTLFSDDTNTLMVLGANGRVKWEVGKTYAVQPGRGMPTIWWRDLDGRIETNIPQYDPLPKPWHDRGVKETLIMHGFKPLRILITWISIGQLQDITESGAIAEGLQPIDGFGFMDEPPGPYDVITALEQYQELWNKINAHFGGWGWNSNPRVFTLTFERVENAVNEYAPLAVSREEIRQWAEWDHEL